MGVRSSPIIHPVAPGELIHLICLNTAPRLLWFNLHIETEPRTMEIHAHEVMQMMLEKDGGFSRESLAQAITERFGADARFYSCSASGMDVAAVIAFLESRSPS